MTLTDTTELGCCPPGTRCHRPDDACPAYALARESAGTPFTRMGVVRERASYAVCRTSINRSGLSEPSMCPHPTWAVESSGSVVLCTRCGAAVRGT